MRSFVDPRQSPRAPVGDTRRPFARRLEQVEPLSEKCRLGRLYEIERWIKAGRPIQADPRVVPETGRFQSALEVALRSGNHSICQLLLCNGYQIDAEPDSPLNLVLRSRRWDLVDLLLDCGADPHRVDLTDLFDTYNSSLFERFRDVGVDIVGDHELADALAYHSGNKPLLGFVKRHLAEEPSYQRELDIALGYHAGECNRKGASLCCWAGADPYARVRDLEYGSDEDEDEDCECALERAASGGDVQILRRLGPDPNRINFDRLFQVAPNRATVELLAEMDRPKDLTRILLSQLCWLSLGGRYDRYEVLLALLGCGVRWEKAEKDDIGEIRRRLLKVSSYRLEGILRLLRNPDVCCPDIYGELTRTPAMLKRMLEVGLIRPAENPVPHIEKERRAIAVLQRRYDREKLYEEVWASPTSQVARLYGVSGVYLARVCRTLRVPVPPRGYWAKLRSGKSVKKPALRALPRTLA